MWYHQYMVVSNPLKYAMELRNKGNFAQVSDCVWWMGRLPARVGIYAVAWVVIMLLMWAVVGWEKAWAHFTNDFSCKIQISWYCILVLFKY